MRLSLLSLLALLVIFSIVGYKFRINSYASSTRLIPFSLDSETIDKRVHPVILHAAALAFIRAYPNDLERYAKHKLYFKDGTTMGFNPAISSSRFHALMSNGRLHLQDFFKKVYGENEGDVVQNLGSVKWLPNSKNSTLSFTTRCGAADALGKVSTTLDTMPGFHKYLSPCSGTFVWRSISGSGTLSNHSFGIAIDINSKYGNYWRWAPEFKTGEPLKFRNRIPMEIVEVFEANGFVWGGRWPHYDTMHFEYHPEVQKYNRWFERSIFNSAKH